MDDILEAGIFDPSFQVRPGTRLTVQLRPRRVDEQLDPLHEVVLVGDGAVLGVVQKVIVLELSPAAWVERPSGC